MGKILIDCKKWQQIPIVVLSSGKVIMSCLFFEINILIICLIICDKELIQKSLVTSTYFLTSVCAPKLYNESIIELNLLGIKPLAFTDL